MITNATTENAIRDRAEAVIRALVPTYLPGSKFVPFRNEGDAEMPDWCEANPQSSLRRYQVRFDGATDAPDVADYVHEERLVLLTTIIAYPHNYKTGAKAGLDRDTAISRDRDLLDRAIGLYSRPNFVDPYPDASWRSGGATRIPGGVVDFLVITGTFSYRRAL